MNTYADNLSVTKYTRSVRWLHWLVFAFVLLAYLFINLRGAYDRGSAEQLLMMQWHKLTGVIAFLLVLPRLLHRWRNIPPAVVPPIAPWEATLSKIMHFALYAFLVVQPLLGLFTSFAGGRGVGIPGTALQIPSPMTANKALAEQLGNIHGWIGNAFYFVIGLHIAAALWHHFFRHDNTLKRML